MLPPASAQESTPEPLVVRTWSVSPSTAGKVYSLPTFSVPAWIVPDVVKSPVPEKSFVAKEYWAGATTEQFVPPGEQLGSNVAPKSYLLAGGVAKTKSVVAKSPARTKPIKTEKKTPLSNVFFFGGSGRFCGIKIFFMGTGGISANWTSSFSGAAGKSQNTALLLLNSRELEIKLPKNLSITPACSCKQILQIISFGFFIFLETKTFRFRTIFFAFKTGFFLFIFAFFFRGISLI